MSFDYLESYQTEEIRAGGPLSSWLRFPNFQ